MHSHSNRETATVQHTMHREPLQSYYLQLCVKTGACVAFAGAAAEYGAPRIQCQAFVCFFDLLLTTAPPNMCGGEPTPPPLNTFPHINKPCRCRNAWGPVLSLLLEFSPLIRWLLGVLSRYSRLKRYWLTDPTLIASTSAGPLVCYPHPSHKWVADDVAPKIIVLHSVATLSYFWGELQ